MSYLIVRQGPISGAPLFYMGRGQWSTMLGKALNLEGAELALKVAEGLPERRFGEVHVLPSERGEALVLAWDKARRSKKPLGARELNLATFGARAALRAERAVTYH